MMDSDGDGAVTLAELMTALKECWAINQVVAAKDRPEAIDVLVKASLTLRKDKVLVWKLRLRGGRTMESLDIF